jgi:catechol 2,3-dioxygenase-like lactoylglutathione lyase family enzyme
VKTLETVIDHITLQVSDVPTSERFYRPLLAACGMRVVARDGSTVGFGPGEKAELWLIPATGDADRELHVAFRVEDRQLVDLFHKTAVSEGVEVLGGPRIMNEYEPGYYACYIRDPDGHNIEVVCRGSAS